MTQLKRTTTLTLLLTAALTPTAWAQRPDRVEVQANGGFTLSSGLRVTERDTGGDVIDRISPKSSGSFSLKVSGLLTDHMEVGFLLGEQFSTLELTARDGDKIDASDLRVDNAHGVFIYTVGEREDLVRPFFLAGAGVTRFVPGDLEGRPLQTESHFSTVWGAGVKVFPSPQLGFNFTARWTPTRLGTAEGFVWCSDFPEVCWELADSRNVHQLDLSAGVNFRF